MYINDIKDIFLVDLEFVREQPNWNKFVKDFNKKSLTIKENIDLYKFLEVNKHLISALKENNEQLYKSLIETFSKNIFESKYVVENVWAQPRNDKDINYVLGFLKNGLLVEDAANKLQDVMGYKDLFQQIELQKEYMPRSNFADTLANFIIRLEPKDSGIKKMQDAILSDNDLASMIVTPLEIKESIRDIHSFDSTAKKLHNDLEDLKNLGKLNSEEAKKKLYIRANHLQTHPDNLKNHYIKKYRKSALAWNTPVTESAIALAIDLSKAKKAGTLDKIAETQLLMKHANSKGVDSDLLYSTLKEMFGKKKVIPTLKINENSFRNRFWFDSKNNRMVNVDEKFEHTDEIFKHPEKFGLTHRQVHDHIFNAIKSDDFGVKFSDKQEEEEWKNKPFTWKILQDWNYPLNSGIANILGPEWVRCWISGKTCNLENWGGDNRVTRKTVSYIIKNITPEPENYVIEQRADFIPPQEKYFELHGFKQINQYIKTGKIPTDKRMVKEKARKVTLDKLYRLGDAMVKTQEARTFGRKPEDLGYKIVKPGVHHHHDEKNKECFNCGGSGEIPGRWPPTCPVCKGSGQVKESKLWTADHSRVFESLEKIISDINNMDDWFELAKNEAFNYSSKFNFNHDSYNWFLESLSYRLWQNNLLSENEINHIGWYCYVNNIIKESGIEKINELVEQYSLMYPREDSSEFAKSVINHIAIRLGVTEDVVQFTGNLNPVVKKDKPAKMINLQKARNWIDDYGNLNRKIPNEAVDDCTSPGQDAYENVSYWVDKLKFEVPREKAIRYIENTGGWTADELQDNTDHDLNCKVFWLVCNEIKEQGEWFGLNEDVVDFPNRKELLTNRLLVWANDLILNSDIADKSQSESIRNTIIKKIQEKGLDPKEFDKDFIEAFGISIMNAITLKRLDNMNAMSDMHRFEGQMHEAISNLTANKCRTGLWRFLRKLTDSSNISMLSNFESYDGKDKISLKMNVHENSLKKLNIIANKLKDKLKAEGWMSNPEETKFIKGDADNGAMVILNSINKVFRSGPYRNKEVPTLGIEVIGSKRINLNSSIKN